MKKILIGFLMSAFIFQTASASVVKSFDQDKKCTLFRATSDETPITSAEEVVLERDVYGISFVDMDIDFNAKKALVTPVALVVLGLNKSITANKVFISPKNSDFKHLVNQLNRKLLVFEKLCISKENEVIYGKEFEAKPEQK